MKPSLRNRKVKSVITRMEKLRLDLKELSNLPAIPGINVLRRLGNQIHGECQNLKTNAEMNPDFTGKEAIFREDEN